MGWLSSGLCELKFFNISEMTGTWNRDVPEDTEENRVLRRKTDVRNFIIQSLPSSTAFIKLMTQIHDAHFSAFMR